MYHSIVNNQEGASQTSFLFLPIPFPDLETSPLFSALFQRQMLPSLSYARWLQTVSSNSSFQRALENEQAGLRPKLNHHSQMRAGWRHFQICKAEKFSKHKLSLGGKCLKTVFNKEKQEVYKRRQQTQDITLKKKLKKMVTNMPIHDRL